MYVAQLTLQECLLPFATSWLTSFALTRICPTRSCFGRRRNARICTEEKRPYFSVEYHKISGYFATRGRAYYRSPLPRNSFLSPFSLLSTSILYHIPIFAVPPFIDYHLNTSSHLLVCCIITFRLYHIIPFSHPIDPNDPIIIKVSNQLACYLKLISRYEFIFKIALNISYHEICKNLTIFLITFLELFGLL